MTTHIYSDHANRIYDKLLTSLGTENVPFQWQIFMRTVRSEMPVLFKEGRTSKHDIERSIVGILGFNSWREMLETSVQNGGLGVSFSRWKEWSRAYSVISDLDDFHKSDLTPSEIIRMSQHCKKNDIEFPTTVAQYEQIRQAKSDDLKTEKEQSIADFQAEIQRLKDENQSLKMRVRDTDLEELFTRVGQKVTDHTDQIGKIADLLNDQNVRLLDEIHDLNSEIKTLSVALEKAETRSKRQQSRLRSLESETLFQHFCRVILGRR